jgi:hypothetical protein
VEPVHLRRNVSFEFPEDQFLEKLFFPLPLRYPESDAFPRDRPMDEIRGIRGVRFIEGTEDELYSFIMDRPSNVRWCRSSLPSCARASCSQSYVGISYSWSAKRTAWRPVPRCRTDIDRAQGAPETAGRLTRVLPTMWIAH